MTVSFGLVNLASITEGGVGRFGACGVTRGDICNVVHVKLGARSETHEKDATTED